MRDRSLWAAALAGVGAAGFGVGLSHLVAGWLNPAASPVVAVGAVVIDATPLPVKEWAAATFGTADKAVLIGGVLVLLGLLGAWAGVATGRSALKTPGFLAAEVPGASVNSRHRGFSGKSSPIAHILIGTLTVVGAAAALSRPTAVFWDIIPSLVAGGAAAAAMRLLFSKPPSSARPGLPRRRLLLGGLGLAASGGILGSLGRPAPSTAPVMLPTPTSTPSVPDASLDAVAPGISPLRTPIDDFYRIDIALALPRTSAADWKLTIDGMVERPLTVTWDELIAMPAIERDITLTCVSNEIGGPLCGSTRWTGVRVADLLRRASPSAAADMVLSSSPDGFSASTPLAVLLDGRDAMIAFAMDGQPLTPTHGAPARLLTPGLYGFVGATKWVSRLKLTRFDQEQAYWTQRGWSDRAPVKTACRIDTPRVGVDRGQVVIGGVAWATHRGISRVEVKIGEGAWQEARLSGDLGTDFWRQWALVWSAPPGTHQITARAYDGSGVVQPAESRPVVPDGPTGYHSVTVRVN